MSKARVPYSLVSAGMLVLAAFCLCATLISCGHTSTPSADASEDTTTKNPAPAPGLVMPGVPELLSEPFRMPEDFPLPEDAARVSPDPEAHDIVFHTSKSLDEILQFYRARLSSVGLTEHGSSTKRNQFGFRVAFLGWPGRKAILIQATDATRFMDQGTLPRVVSARLVPVEVRGSGATPAAEKKTEAQPGGVSELTQ